MSLRILLWNQAGFIISYSSLQPTGTTGALACKACWRVAFFFLSFFFFLPHEEVCIFGEFWRLAEPRLLFLFIYLFSKKPPFTRLAALRHHRTIWFSLPFCWLPYTVLGRKKAREGICASRASVPGDTCCLVCGESLCHKPKARESGEALPLAPRGAGSVFFKKVKKLCLSCSFFFP